MKTIQFKLLNRYNAFITAILAILGYACTKDSNSPVEYGTPSAKFIVNGKVTSVATDAPIKNIRVTMYRDTAYTDNNGNYEVSDNYGFPMDTIYPIQFKDVDNGQNGDFEDKNATVEFKDEEYTGGNGHWYRGETTRKLDIKLDVKE